MDYDKLINTPIFLLWLKSNVAILLPGLSVGASKSWMSSTWLFDGSNLLVLGFCVKIMAVNVENPSWCTPAQKYRARKAIHRAWSLRVKILWDMYRGCLERWMLEQAKVSNNTWENGKKSDMIQCLQDWTNQQILIWGNDHGNNWKQSSSGNLWWFKDTDKTFIFEGCIGVARAWKKCIKAPTKGPNNEMLVGLLLLIFFWANSWL